MTFTASIPGRITMEQAVELAALAKGKTVLQIGCYCGRATLALAAVAEKVYLLDDFSGYLGGRDVAEEIKKNVLSAGPDIDNRIELVFGDTDDPALAAPLPAFDVAYIDADRDEERIATDLAFVRRALKDNSLLVFHEGKRMVVQEVRNGHLVPGLLELPIAV